MGEEFDLFLFHSNKKYVFEYFGGSSNVFTYLTFLSVLLLKMFY